MACQRQQPRPLDAKESGDIHDPVCNNAMFLVVGGMSRNCRGVGECESLSTLIYALELTCCVRVRDSRAPAKLIEGWTAVSAGETRLHGLVPRFGCVRR